MANFVPSRVHLDYVETLVYTAPGGGALLLSAVAANIHSDDVRVSILVRSGLEDYYLLSNASIPVSASLSCLAGKVSLSSGDEVFALGEVDEATPPTEFADLYLTALEM